VFLEDKNYANAFDSLSVDVNIPTPQSWGGTDKNVSFDALPQCLRYSILDSNEMKLEFTCPDFNAMLVERQDLNFSLRTNHDFNALTCTINGASGCSYSDYNSQDSLPYFSVTFLDANCFNCALPSTVIGSHYDPLQENSVRMYCTGAACESSALDLNLSGGTTHLRYAGQIMDAVIALEIGEVESFSLADVNINVFNQTFGARRWG
ncbi:MAG: hypothetical protein NUV67_00680, partial [archaeon]|nr:hypothetical protein [archaeon]